MSAKKMFVASLITALLTGCGGGAANQPPALSDDGTYTDAAPMTSDGSDYGSDTSYDPNADLGTDPTDTGSPSPDDSASPGATTQSYTLMGKVLDASGKAVVGASVSIGSQTVLTDTSGVYNISGITDTKVFVSVTMKDYDSISGISVDLTADASTTTVTKTFELAKSDSSSGDTEAGLTHELTYTAAKFKSVNAMVSFQGNVYVLGVLDGLLFDSASVVTFSEDGNQIDDFKKVGFLKSLPKDVNYLVVNSDDQLVVSNASAGYAFSAAGDFLQGVSAIKTKSLTKVKDTNNSITYEIKDGTHVNVTYDGDTKPFKLDEVGHASALALDSDDHLLVLDSTNKVVHSFTFEPGDD